MDVAAGRRSSLIAWCGWGLLIVAISGLCGCGTSLQFVDRHEQLFTAFLHATPVKPDGLSDQTWELLRYWDLEAQYLVDPDKTLQQARQIFYEHPEPAWAFALSELCYRSAEQLEQRMPHPLLGDSLKRYHSGHNPLESQIAELYLDSVSYAYYFLFANDASLSVFDRRNSPVCSYYNSGLQRCLEWAGKNGRLNPRGGCALLTSGGAAPCQLRREGFCWAEEEIDELILAKAYQTSDLIRHQREFGLGVPFVGVRHHQGDHTKRDQFLGSKHPFAITAFFHPNLRRLTSKVAPEFAQRSSPDSVEVGELVLYDPLNRPTIDVADEEVPLEMDLGAPMAYVLETTTRPTVSLGGFLEPDSITSASGLYTYEAYQPGKMPVVFVHGLLSGPITWSEMFRELVSDPEIRERYQFWFYLYPTGEPFPISARKLRQQLQQLHDTYAHDDPAYEHFILVGHSMGGLLSKLQVTESGNQLWDLVCNVSVDELKTDPATREKLRETFFFEPLPYVDHVVFLGTPHHGSKVSQAPIGRLGSWLVHLPSQLRSTQRQLVRDNPRAFKRIYTRGVPTSVDLLAADNPLLERVNQLAYSDHVHLHSVVGTSQGISHTPNLIALLTGGANLEPGDGVVPVSSASITETDSEIRVPATHVKLHRHALAVQEVGRILRQQSQSVSAAQLIEPIGLDDDPRAGAVRVDDLPP